MKRFLTENITEEPGLPRIFGLSGGRTSAYMLWLAMQEGLRPDDIISFQNTGKEKEETYKFLLEIECNWNIKLIWLEYDEEYGFKVVDFARANRDGKPFNEMLSKKQFLPNAAKRICSTELKIRPLKKYLKYIGINRYNSITGIRADEPVRIIKAELSNLNDKDGFRKVLPLAIAGITKANVKAFWDAQPFDLQLNNDQGNCDLCFMKGKEKLIRLIRANPEMADWWIEKEKERRATFHKTHSYEELKAVALGQSQLPLNWNEIKCTGCND